MNPSTPIRPGRPYRILSIDGGGIRGAAPAAFLQALEKEIGGPLGKKFDCIAGTSAGGLLALYLGGLGGKAEDAAKLFDRALAGRIMDKSALDKIVPPAFQWKPVYDGVGKRQTLTEVFGDHRLHEAVTPVMVTAYDVAAKRMLVFKSAGGDDGADNPLMCEVADATSAAPMYFPAAKVGDAPARYLIDGGVAQNNPAICVLSEAIKAGIDPRDIVLVSLGTGAKVMSAAEIQDFQEHNGSWGAIDWLRHDLVGQIMDGAGSAVDYFCKQVLGERYIRVQGPITAPSTEMDDTSDENIAALKKMGQDWYQKFGPAVVSRMQPPIKMSSAVVGETMRVA